MSYAVQALSLVATMLSNCAAFRTLVGAEDATAALSFIIDTDGGDPSDTGKQAGYAIATNGNTIDLAKPHAIIGIPDGIQRAPGGVAYDDITFQPRITLVHPRTQDGESRPAAKNRALTTSEDIAQQLTAQRGSATALADYEVSTGGLQRDDDGGPHRDHYLTEITINARG